MYRLIPLLALAATVAGSPAQEILRESPGSPDTQLPVNSKPLVSTEALQKHITSAGLKKRAEKLYEIAKESLDEYNHPTRVIGSEGWLLMIHHPLSIDEMLTLRMERAHCDSRLHLRHYRRAG
jgi:aminopeptidase Y